MAKGAGGASRPAAFSRASTVTPSHSVSSLLHLVTQWMSTVMRVFGSAWNSAQDHLASSEPPCWRAKLQSSGRVRGVGPADSTGKSAVTCWPGGTRAAAAASAPPRRPRNPHERGGSLMGRASFLDRSARRAAGRAENHQSVFAMSVAHLRYPRAAMNLYALPFRFMADSFF